MPMQILYKGHIISKYFGEQKIVAQYQHVIVATKDGKVHDFSFISHL
jgi:hypothetical protein